MSVTSCFQPSTIAPDRWLNIDDAARRFGVSRRTVHRWVKAGAPVIRLTRKLVFSPPALEIWLRAQFGAGAWPDDLPARPRGRGRPRRGATR